MNRRLRTLVISTVAVLWAAVSLVEANWSMNYPMNGNTLEADNTPGTGNTPQGSITVTYRIGKYIIVNGEEEFFVHGIVTGPNETFGGWYLNIYYTTPGTGLRAELLEGEALRVACENLTVVDE